MYLFPRVNIHHGLSCVSPFITPWTIVCQAPLSMGLSRQQYWSELPFPSLGDLPNPGIEPVSLMSLVLAGRFFTIFRVYFYISLIKQ